MGCFLKISIFEAKLSSYECIGLLLRILRDFILVAMLLVDIGTGHKFIWCFYS